MAYSVAQISLSELLGSGVAGLVAVALIFIVMKFLAHLAARDTRDAERSKQVAASFAKKDQQVAEAHERFLTFLSEDRDGQRRMCHEALAGVCTALEQVRLGLARLNGKPDP